MIQSALLCLMASLKEISEGTTGQIAIIGFRSVIAILLGLLAWIGNNVYVKVEASADKIEVAKTVADLQTKIDSSNTKLWEAIGKTATALNSMTNSVNTLQVQFVGHSRMDDNMENEVKDHELRMRVLEAVKPIQHQ